MRRNYTRKRNLTKLFLTVALFVAIFAAAVFYFSDRSKNDVVIAKVNNKKIYKSEIERKISLVFSLNGDKGQIPQLESLPVELVETLAKEIYFEKELVARAKKSKIMKDPDLKAKLKETEAKIITAAYLESILKEKVTDEKISEKYAELSNDLKGKKEFSIAHIIVKEKEEADKIYKSLTDKKSKKNVKFSDLAKKYSLDKDSANKGGSLGYMLEDNIIKEIAELLPKLKKGEISEPVKTKFGWHIIKLDDIRDPKALTFEEAKQNIKDQLVRNETSSLYNDIFKDAKIKILIEDKVKNKDKAEVEEKTDNSQEQTANENQQESEKSEESSDKSQEKSE